MSKKPRKAKDLFIPDTAKPMSLHDRTNAAARAIIDSENKSRAEKTARLRAIRLGQVQPGNPKAQTTRLKKA